LGTLIPPLITGQLGEILAKAGANWVLADIAIGTLGIFLSGLAGRLKELDLGANVGTFNLAKGLPLCIMAGILSAVYGFSLAAGQPIADVAASYGAGHFEGNVIYIFSNTGAFLTTALYCIWLHRRERTLGEYFKPPTGMTRKRLLVNWLMACATGCLWYGQFFFYGLGHVRMGDYKFTSWGIHMIMLVLFSAVVGLIFREWRGCRSRTWYSLAAALLVLIAAVLALAYGSYIGEIHAIGD
jgi:L-rhamnose-H+ transport protein